MAMEASALPRTWLTPSSSKALILQASRSSVTGVRCDHARRPTRAVADVVADSLNITSPVEVSWEIIVGSIAGTAPFVVAVVAGIEFSKRIKAQRKCVTCKGSGLVRREKYFFRCPSCGGFLPWQSWKRFFTG